MIGNTVICVVLLLDLLYCTYDHVVFCQVYPPGHVYHTPTLDIVRREMTPLCEQTHIHISLTTTSRDSSRLELHSCRARFSGKNKYLY